jgi:hypothetical protein
MKTYAAVRRGTIVIFMLCIIAGLSAVCLAAPGYEVVGIRGKGASAFFILDASPSMMMDKMGGILGYELKKQAFLQSIQKLPSSMEFNVVVYSGVDTRILFPRMVPVNETNRQKVSDWLKPLNVKQGGEYGLKTLAPGGQKNDADAWVDPFDFNNEDGTRPVGLDGWFPPTMLAMQAQAGSVFLFTCDWGHQRVKVPGANIPKWKKSSAGKRWEKSYREGLEMLEEENADRRAKGQPPRIIAKTPHEINRTYFPNIKLPPPDEFVEFAMKDYLEGFLTIRDSGLSGKIKSKKGDISMNIILFGPKNAKRDTAYENFEDLASACNGKMSPLKGDSAIQRYLDAD